MATPETPLVTASLAVSRKHLFDALRQIKKLIGLSGQSAVFTFEQQQLCIDLGGCSFRADAEGTWHGQAAVSVGFLQEVAKALPTGKGSITTSCDGQFLQVGDLKVKCKWDRLRYPRITLPLGASLPEILSLRKRYSNDDIQHSELDNVVVEAESKGVRLIEKAAAMLQPLGFTEDDLRRVLEEKVAAIVRTDNRG